MFFRFLWTLSASAVVGLSVSLPASADDRDELLIGVQPDGRVLVPTNQVLQPAGQQITFPGRPVDVALAADGQLLASGSGAPEQVVKLWAVGGTWSNTTTLTGAGGSVTSVQFSGA